MKKKSITGNESDRKQFENLLKTMSMDQLSQEGLFYLSVLSGIADLLQDYKNDKGLIALSQILGNNLKFVENEIENRRKKSVSGKGRC